MDRDPRFNSGPRLQPAPQRSGGEGCPPQPRNRGGEAGHHPQSTRKLWRDAAEPSVHGIEQELVQLAVQRDGQPQRPVRSQVFGPQPHDPAHHLARFQRVGLPIEH